MLKKEEIGFQKIVCPDCKTDNITLLSCDFKFKGHSAGVEVYFSCDSCKKNLIAEYKLNDIRIDTRIVCSNRNIDDMNPLERCTHCGHLFASHYVDSDGVLRVRPLKTGD